MHDVREFCISRGRARGGEFVDAIRKARGDICDAARVGADAEAVVRGHAVVACAADPVQAVADSRDDLLEAADVALAVLECDEVWDRREALDGGGREIRVVTTVDQHAAFRRSGDVAVVVEEAFVIRVAGVVRREDEDAIHARGGAGARHVHSGLRAEADACEHGMAALHFLDGRLHHGEMLLRGKRVQFARARASDDGAELLADELAEIFTKTGKIEREIFFERRDGERDDASEAGAELCGCEWHELGKWSVLSSQFSVAMARRREKTEH